MSVDLLRQFIHNISEKELRMDAAAEAESMEQFWRALQGKEDRFEEFFRALEPVNRILRRRADGLRIEILDRLEPVGVVEDSYVVAGYDHKWGLSEVCVAVVYVGFKLVTGQGVELILGFVPEPRRNGLHVKAFAPWNGPKRVSCPATTTCPSASTTRILTRTSQTDSCG